MAFFSMKLGTHRVPMSMHASHRQKLRETLKAPPHSVVILEGGVESERYDTDCNWVFRQESHFHYLFGVKEPDCYGLLDLETGRSILFVPRLPEDFAVWMGKIKTTEEFRVQYETDEVRFIDEIDNTLAELKAGQLYFIKGENSDSGKILEPSCKAVTSLEKYKINKDDLWTALCKCRSIKSPQEVEVLRYVTRISSEAHVAVMRACKPGMAEYQLESLFLDYVYRNGGCRSLAYICICGSGEHTATLHYQQNDKLIEDGDMMLMDMGGEYHCYCSDITCAFPANGKFTPDQKVVFNAVRGAQVAVLGQMKPGVKWPDMHRLAEKTILEHLLNAGWLKGTLEALVKENIAQYFMPHGLGHLLGLDTHDVGGYPHPLVRSQEPGIKKLRTGRTLEPGLFITVEPGCYLIGALLRPVLSASSPLNHHFNVEKLTQLLDQGFGGVRLEDDVLVTETGIENLTHCPRTVAEVEHVMAGGDFPLSH